MGRKPTMPHQQPRRHVITAIGAAALAAPVIARAQTPPPAAPAVAAPPTTITNPPRDFRPGGAPTALFPHPDLVTVDPAFNGITQPNAAIVRLWTGALWS